MLDILSENRYHFRWVRNPVVDLYTNLQQNFHNSIISSLKYGHGNLLFLFVSVIFHKD